MNLEKDLTTGALKLSGVLDFDAANALREELLDAFSRHSEVTLDLASVSAIDTTALQVLLAGPREAASQGKSFRLVAVSPAVMEMTEALGFAVTAQSSVGDAS